MLHLQDLPHEILYNIVSNLSLKDFIHTYFTCSYFSNIYKDDFLWKHIIYNTYGVKEKINQEQTWYNNCAYITTLFDPTQLYVVKNDMTYLQNKILLLLLH